MFIPLVRAGRSVLANSIVGINLNLTRSVSLAPEFPVGSIDPIMLLRVDEIIADVVIDIELPGKKNVESVILNTRVFSIGSERSALVESKVFAALEEDDKKKLLDKIKFYTKAFRKKEAYQSYINSLRAGGSENPSTDIATVQAAELAYTEADENKQQQRMQFIRKFLNETALNVSTEIQNSEPIDLAMLETIDDGTYTAVQNMLKSETHQINNLLINK